MLCSHRAALDRFSLPSSFLLVERYRIVFRTLLKKRLNGLAGNHRIQVGRRSVPDPVGIGGGQPGENLVAKVMERNAVRSGAGRQRASPIDVIN